jgi:hypothetical protein
MKGISLFGNAMKTWSPERTFPSLRGHPPLLELADECRIPDTLSPPDTGIEMTVPAEHAWLYPAVPLAYWLGATVESGPPALYADGRRYPLGTEAGYEAASDREAFERHVQDVPGGLDQTRRLRSRGAASHPSGHSPTARRNAANRTFTSLMAVAFARR